MLTLVESAEGMNRPKQELAWGSLFEKLEVRTEELAGQLAERSVRGQFFTPTNTARFMASLFTRRFDPLHILDAGAGLGALSAALVVAACEWSNRPAQIYLTAFENDPIVLPYLQDTQNELVSFAASRHVALKFQIIPDDFIRSAIEVVRGQVLLRPQFGPFNAVILNPPYRKIQNTTKTRRILQRAKIETTNLYAAFVWLATQLLQPEGELVALTPRSFCNGPYFRPFRKYLLSHLSLQRIHVFDVRQDLFKRDDVLQENIILHGIKHPQDDTVLISTSARAGDEFVSERRVPVAQLVHPNDPESFIRIVPDDLTHALVTPLAELTTKLEDLGLSVSTGRVVEFRNAALLTHESNTRHVPLIYPHNLKNGFVKWANGDSQKPTGIVLSPQSERLLLPRGVYVLVKRFTAKEEARRIVAAVLDPQTLDTEWYAFENHLNFYHDHETGFDLTLAKGLAAYLNSSMVDEFFRHLSGHTQVNATDLRSLHYPDYDQLFAIGSTIGNEFPNQQALDELVSEVLQMGNKIPLRAKQKINDARAILQAVGAPKEQQNTRAALTLLGLVNLKPSENWRASAAPLVGIHELLGFFAENYGVTYAENTRETVRRYTMHRFMQMGLARKNPDDPARPVNSPDTRYQIEPAFLELVQAYGTEEWDKRLSLFLRSAKHLARLRARERNLELMAVNLPDGAQIKLSRGGQNQLVKEIIEQFCPRFTPGGKILYLGDAGAKLRVYAAEQLAALNVKLDKHGKLPDVIVHYEDKQWLVLIEAVTSHGAISVKRHNELKDLFRTSKSPLVFVTAFPDRKHMVKYLGALAWETEVWLADAPDHLIHFDGERFLGPYE